MNVSRRVISIIVENESSVLSRISGLFAGRGYNIETLTVAPIPNSNQSHLTIATKGDKKTPPAPTHRETAAAIRAIRPGSGSC